MELTPPDHDAYQTSSSSEETGGLGPKVDEKEEDVKAPPLNSEVKPKVKRRRHTSAYKLKILKEADASDKKGAIGALFCREGLYSSNLAAWRRQMLQGTLGTKNRSKPSATELEVAHKKLQREHHRLQEELKKAELIIEFQNKTSEILNLIEKEN